MNITIKGEWRESKTLAEEDRDYFANLFQVENGFGIEGVRLTERDEWRGTCDIELDEYEIEKKK